MVDVIQSKSDAQKVAERLKPSAGPMPDTATTQVTQGAGTANRIITTIHRGSQQSQHGAADHGGPNIVGGRR